MVLRELILVARECKGWSQRELSKRSGVGHIVIAQIEIGHIHMPGFDKIVAIADALEIPVERFAATVRLLKPEQVLRSSVPRPVALPSQEIEND